MIVQMKGNRVEVDKSGCNFKGKVKQETVQCPMVVLLEKKEKERALSSCLISIGNSLPTSLTEVVQTSLVSSFDCNSFPFRDFRLYMHNRICLLQDSNLALYNAMEM